MAAVTALDTGRCHTHLDIEAQISAAKGLGNRQAAVVELDLTPGRINGLSIAPNYAITSPSYGIAVK